MVSSLYAFMSIETHNNKLKFATGDLYHINNHNEKKMRDYVKTIDDQLGNLNAYLFPLVYHKIGQNSTEHYVFQQAHKGIPVFGKYLRLHTNGNIITSLSNNTEPVLTNNIPYINKKESMDIISKTITNTNNNNYVKYEKLQFYLFNNKTYLAHTISVVDFEYPWRFFVDAHTGDIIDKIPLFYEDGPTLGSGINLLNESVDSLNIYEGNTFSSMGTDLVTPYLLCENYCFDYGDCGGDTYSDCIPSPEQGNCPNGYILDCNGECFNEWYMQFPGVGNGFCNDPWLDYLEENITSGAFNMVDESNSILGNIYTINSYGGFYSDLSYVNSETSNFIDSYTPHSHKSGVSAHDYQRKTLDYFWDEHGYAGIDGSGKRTISVVNYTNVAGGLDQRNAFYNAALDVLTYGLGGNGYRPFCAAQDIVTHEFVHGVTAHTSGLIYRNQSGAINESMSDVFGYFVEAKYQNGGDWTQGEDVHYVGASRSFINPPDYNQPDHIDHPYFIEYNPNPAWSNDFGGVHYNSGITNKIMYLVIAGDVHYGINVLPFDEDINTSRNVAAKIWFAWNNYYLDPEDDFMAGRAKMLQACYDLFPNNISYYQTIASAWASTGVGEEINFPPGDINGDFTINILDIIELVNIILYDNGADFLSVADLNNDNDINILDIIELINLILFY